MGCGQTRQRSSRRAELRLKHEVEGYKGRIVHLFHVTSAEAAKLIVNSLMMIPGSKGLFGAGIYFAETYEIAETRKALHHGACIEADVMLGFSLVCRQKMYDMNYETLRKTYGCHSVKGDKGAVNFVEYVVYQWTQVNIKLVKIGNEVYYQSTGKEGMRLCKNSRCEFLGRKHIGSCRMKCANPNCNLNGEAHLGKCEIRCSNIRCIDTGLRHEGACKLKCNNTKCSLEGQYHTEDCIIPCKKERCQNYGVPHPAPCVLQCINPKCEEHQSYHAGGCKLKCGNVKCVHNGMYHPGKCTVRCMNEQCVHFDECHEGNCKLKCKNKKCANEGSYHAGDCELNCKNINCDKFGTPHPGKCTNS